MSSSVDTRYRYPGAVKLAGRCFELDRVTLEVDPPELPPIGWAAHTFDPPRARRLELELLGEEGAPLPALLGLYNAAAPAIPVRAVLHRGLYQEAATVEAAGHAIALSPLGFADRFSKAIDPAWLERLERLGYSWDPRRAVLAWSVTVQLAGDVLVGLAGGELEAHDGGGLPW